MCLRLLPAICRSVIWTHLQEKSAVVPEQTRLPRKQVSGQSSGLQGAGEHLQVAPTHPARGWLLGQGAHGTLLELQTKVHTKLRKHRGGPYEGLPLVESGYHSFHYEDTMLKECQPHGK